MHVDTTKLVKLLKLTGSNVDPEALSAARKANALLAKGGLTWDALMLDPTRCRAKGSRAQQAPPPSQEPELWEFVEEWDDYSSIEKSDLVEFCVSHCSPDFQNLYDGIYVNWNKHGRLTPKQIKCIITNARYKGRL